MNDSTTIDPEALTFTLAYGVVIILGIIGFVSNMISDWKENRKKKK